MSETRLHEYLRGTNSAQRFATLARLLFVGLLGAMLLLASAVSFDAALSLPNWFRALLDLAFLTAGIAAVVYFARTFLSFQFLGQRAARRVEESLAIDDNAFVNSVDLGDKPLANISEQLRASAIDKGNRLSYSYSPFSAVSFAPALKALASAMIATVAVAIFYFASPQMFERVLPRYLDPFGNHPAYTSLEFEVTVNPTRVEFGQSANVFVSIKGANLPAAANLVRQTDFGEEETPMLNSSDGEFHLELSDLTQRVEFVIKTERGDSESHVIEVLPIPNFEKVWTQLEYPDYTGWKPVRRLMKSSNIRALRRSKVTLEVESNVPLESGRLFLTSQEGEDVGQPLSMAPVEGNQNQVSATFEMKNQTRFEMDLLATNGTSSDENNRGTIHVVEDRPPQIRIASPQLQVIAVEGSTVPIRIQVSDDIGLNQLTFFRSINGIGPFSRILEDSFGDQPFRNDTIEFDLGALGAEAGDVIKYYASVSDNYPAEFSGSEDHLVLSETGAIRVISLDDYQEMARRQYRMDDVIDEINSIKDQLEELQKQRNEILEELKKLEDAIESGQELSEDEQQRMQQLLEQLDDFVEQSNSLAEQLKERAKQTPIYDFEDSLQKQLNELADQLEQQSQDAAELSEAMKDPENRNSQASKSARKKFQENDKPFDEDSKQERENMEKDLVKLASAEDLLEQVARLKSIVEQQREIADRMKAFQNEKELSDEQKRTLKKLAKEQDLLKQELSDTMEEIKQAAEKAEEEFPESASSMLDIVSAIAESGVLDDQQSAAESGQQLDAQKAAEAAEEAARKLEALQCDCNSNSMGQEMQAGDRPLSIPKDGMSRSLDQLAQSMKIPSLKIGKGRRGMSGYRGSISQASLIGPHSQSRIDDSRRRGRSGDRNQGSGGNGTVAGAALAPEQLTPDARDSKTTGPTNMQGVPSAYTDHARAYLKRIAEDTTPENE